MILVDKQIKTKIEVEKMICEGYKPENLHGISYDILIESIILPDKTDESKFIEKNTYNLRSGETVYIKSDIEINMPVDCVGKIVERNSVMRMGLEVSGPCYQPGHRTKIFLRIHNIVSKDIVIQKGQGIAQIMFEYLPIKPDKPYSKDIDNSYQNELNYIGVQGQWKNDWLGQLEKYNQKMEELDNTENRIYGNIITIMGVFLTMFSLITYNFSTIANNANFKNVLGIDFSLTLLMYILLGAIVLILNRRRETRFYVTYGLILLVLVGINIFGWTKGLFFG